MRRTWWLVLSAFVAITVALGGATLGFTRYQRDIFTTTTSSFEAQVGTLAALERNLILAKVPMGSVLYELERTGELEHEWHQFNVHARRIDQDLAALQALPEHGASESIDRAAAAWKRVVDGTTEAKGMWGTGTVAAALAEGNDPFSDTVWAAESEMQDALAEASLKNVAQLREEARQAQQRQATLEPLLAVVILLTMGLSGLSAWRLSTRVLRPLLALRTSAARIRDGVLAAPADLPRSAGREVVELAASVSEMTRALTESHEQLYSHAYTDGLTGLGNRRALTELIDSAFPTAAPGSLALLLIDLDDFKVVNDSLGHLAGDRLLVVVGERIRAAARHADLVARFGGDEFAVVIQAADARAAASLLAERILASLGADVELEGQRVHVGCSIGIATGAPEAASPEALVRNADIAMYMAKSQGKHRLSVFDAHVHTAIIGRAEMKQELRRAVELEQLELHHQPIVDLDSGETVGFEALVRWRHPHRGLVAPLDFIGVAEETGDILPIGGWVIDRACQDLAVFSSVDPAAEKLWMSVNVSARQLADDDFVETVRSAVKRHGIDPARLVLELTEQSLMVDVAQATATLADLRRDGVRVAIDDFGTGFSSLRYLDELPIDVLKIDRSFVARTEANVDRSLILEAIVHMGAGLGLELIAEGIERPSERDRLRQLGRMAGQGYLIARPMPGIDVMDFLGAQGERSAPDGAAATAVY